MRPLATTVRIWGCAHEEACAEEVATRTTSRPRSRALRRIHSLSSAAPERFRLSGMRSEISPEPPPDEREALEQALRRLLDPTEGVATSEWWRAGVRESVLDDDEGSGPYRGSSNVCSTSQGAKPWRR
jgi:hypothetical protein